MYDVKTITKWVAPKEDGVAIMTAPNIALPCHQLCPRTIDPRLWEKMRKQCYADANYTCQATGVELGKGKLHAHELVSIDWANQTEVFERTVALDPRIHTRFIHSGRALTMYQKGDKYFPREALLETMEYGFSLIDEWNRTHTDEEPLRVSDTFLEWAKNDTLKTDVNALIEKYHIKFYTFDKSCFNKTNWPKWKLIWNGEEYPTKFPTKQDWEGYFNPKVEEKEPEVVPQELLELDNIIKETNGEDTCMEASNPDD